MKPTPSQTIGPFFRHGFDWLGAGDGRVEVHGRVFDGAGEPVPDAVLELWDGTTFARALTEADGSWSCRVDGPDVVVSLFARGLLQRLVTRFVLDGARPFDIHLQGPQETTFHAW